MNKIDFKDEKVQQKLKLATEIMSKQSPFDFTINFFTGDTAEYLNKMTDSVPDSISEMLTAFDSLAKSMKDKSGEVTIYEIKDELFDIIKNTDNKFFYRRIPQNIIFLDNEFYVKDYIVKGLFIVDDNKHSKDRFIVIGWGINTVKYSTELIFFEVGNSGYQGEKEHKSLALQIVTILDMIDDKRDIEFYEKKIDPERNLKRAKRGKPALHDKIIIRPNQPMKRYLSSFSSDAKFRYSHKFLVRGHYRHYMSDRYSAELRGTKKWVKPYYKNPDGVLITKKYIVK